MFNYSLNYQGNKNNIIIGSTYSEYDGDHFGETIWAQNSGDIEFTDQFYSGNGLKKDFSNFIKSIYQVSSKLNVYSDLQIRNIDYKTYGSTSNLDQLLVDKNYSFFNPKAGINFQRNKKNRFYFSLAKAFREPTRSDFENNISIQPEELIDYEMGWNFNSEKFYLSSNLYYMKYKNQLVLTGSLDDVGTPIRDNSGESYRMGIELESAVVLNSEINISGNISFSENKNINYITNYDGVSVNLGDTDISFSPKFISSLQLSYKPSSNVDISLLNKFVGDQYMSNTESDFSKLDSYAVTDISIRYKCKDTFLFSDVVITAMINNIFDKEYVSNGYYYTYDDTWSNPNAITTIEGSGYYPQATRNFLLGISFKL